MTSNKLFRLSVVSAVFLIVIGGGTLVLAIIGLITKLLMVLG